MSDLKVEGKIYKIFDTQQVTATFSKREFIVLTDENYPQHIKLELTKDQCSILDKFKEEDAVTVFFNLRGREWTPKDGGEPKYFVSLNAWRIEKKADAPQAPANDAPFPADGGSDFNNLVPGEDLPF